MLHSGHMGITNVSEARGGTWKVLAITVVITDYSSSKKLLLIRDRLAKPVVFSLSLNRDLT